MGSLRVSSQVFVRVLLTCTLACGVATSSAAQDLDAPAHVAFVDGVATIERDARVQSAVAGEPFVAGDRVRTVAGRVEILLPDGSTVDLDEHTVLDAQTPTLLRLTGGRILLVVAGAGDPSSAVSYQVDTPAGVVRTDGPGEYRIGLASTAGGIETELVVLRGLGELSTERAATMVRAGERAIARELDAPSYPYPYNSARFDAFARWSAGRRDARTGNLSAGYLPANLHVYAGAFDRHGSWYHEPHYGHVWYPSVAPGWRPYHHGYWAGFTFGWTWIGLDPWAWPTHHYGRWGFARNRWFWMPGRRWGPAWVSWAAAPGFVGWSPLGFDGRPVFGLHARAGYSWAGWSIVSRKHFGGHGFPVHRYALGSVSVPRHAPFIVQAHAPVELPRGRAIPRTPASVDTVRRAVPRTFQRFETAPPTAPASAARRENERATRAAAAPSGWYPPVNMTGRAPRATLAAPMRAQPRRDPLTPGEVARQSSRLSPGVVRPAVPATPSASAQPWPSPRMRPVPPLPSISGPALPQRAPMPRAVPRAGAAAPPRMMRPPSASPPPVTRAPGAHLRSAPPPAAPASESGRPRAVRRQP
jgi:hypothetical protein